MTPRSVADVEGAWGESEFESSLISRCRRFWSVPVENLSNQVLATFVRQRIGLAVVLPEARRRIEEGIDDDSELYDGELADAVRRVTDA